MYANSIVVHLSVCLLGNMYITLHEMKRITRYKLPKKIFFRSVKYGDLKIFDKVGKFS